MKRLSTALVTFALALTKRVGAGRPRTHAGECHDYPFTPLKHTVTHNSWMQELSELESGRL